MQSIKLGIIGAGNMAGALIRGLLASRSLRADQIRVSDVSEEQLRRLHEAHAVGTELNNRTDASWADVAHVAVKPQVVPVILPDLAASYRPDQLLISIAAGIPIASFTEVLPATARIV